MEVLKSPHLCVCVCVCRRLSHLSIAIKYFNKYLNYLFGPPDAPICAIDHEELLGALKHETLPLKCEVDASPPADSFHWTFNSSGEQTELPARLHSSEVRFAKLHSIHQLNLNYYRREQYTNIGPL